MATAAKKKKKSLMDQVAGCLCVKKESPFLRELNMS